VLGTSPCTLKLDKEKLKHAGLVQENSFALRRVCTQLAGAGEKHSKSCAPAREEFRHNKSVSVSCCSLFLIDQSFLIGFAICSLPPICTLGLTINELCCKKCK